MSPWTVILRKPGRPDALYTEVPFLGVYVELPVDRFCVQRSYDEWRTLTVGFDPSLFIERYNVTRIDGNRALAEFVSLRRSHELPRVFNPTRLPA